MSSKTSRWLSFVIVITSLTLLSCSGDEAEAPQDPKAAKEKTDSDKNKKKAAKEKESLKEAKAEKVEPEAEENLDPALKKIHPHGRALLATRKKFYKALKKLVTNPKMPADFMKEEVKDLYDFYENKFVEHGHQIQSLGGDARGTILKIDNYITAEPMRATIWVEKEANRLVQVNPDLGELLLRAYSLPRCYDFALLRKNDPGRAKRLGLME